MKTEILFSEKQRFNQWWLWLLLIGINCITLYGIVQQIILGKPFGDKPASDTGLILASLLPLLIAALFLLFRLETQITKEGIYLQFRPFHGSPKFYSWESLYKSYVRKYSPILEYGGWGMRFGAYNVSGNKGLQLVFNDRKKLLIGTRKPSELEETLKKLGRLKE